MDQIQKSAIFLEEDRAGRLLRQSNFLEEKYLRWPIVEVSMYGWVENPNGEFLGGVLVSLTFLERYVRKPFSHL
jgi:hypothetical protein